MSFAIVRPLRIGAVAALVLLSASGCTTNPNNEALIDPLKQRLMAREDIALQNLLLARTPAYSYAGSGGGSYSYLDAPYDGPAIEPPLPDLNMLPEDMPPWEDFPEETPPPQPEPTPTPIQPVPTGDEPEPEPETTPQPEPAPEATPPAPAEEPTPAEPPTAVEPPVTP